MVQPNMPLPAGDMHLLGLVRGGDAHSKSFVLPEGVTQTINRGDLLAAHSCVSLGRVLSHLVVSRVCPAIKGPKSLKRFGSLWQSLLSRELVFCNFAQVGHEVLRRYNV